MYITVPQDPKIMVPFKLEFNTTVTWNVTYRNTRVWPHHNIRHIIFKHHWHNRVSKFNVNRFTKFTLSNLGGKGVGGELSDLTEFWNTFFTNVFNIPYMIWPSQPSPWIQCKATELRKYGYRKDESLHSLSTRTHLWTIIHFYQIFMNCNRTIHTLHVKVLFIINCCYYFHIFGSIRNITFICFTYCFFYCNQNM